MVKLSDHISWQSTRMPETSDDTSYLFLSYPSVICFSILITILLFYVIMAEKNHAVGRHAIEKGVAWTGATLIAFATASLAALDVALFVAVHGINRFKTSFNEKVLNPIILPAIGRATEFYHTVCNHIVESLDAAKSYLRKLLKDEEKMQQVLGIFCAILIAGFILSSLYLQLSFSGLLSRDDLRYVFKTYLICLSSLGCLMYTIYVALRWIIDDATLIPGHVLDYLRQTAGAYWSRLIMMTYPDDSISTVPQTSDKDILLHLEEDLPTPEELLALHLRSKWEFDFNNQNDLVALFRSLSDDLSLKLPGLLDSESMTIIPPECIIAYDSDIVGVGCMIEFYVTKEQRTIGYFGLSFVPSIDGDVDLTADD